MISAVELISLILKPTIILVPIVLLSILILIVNTK